MPLNTFDVGGCCCGPPCLPCLPCCIPQQNLTLSWTDTGAGGTATLVWVPASLFWQVFSVPRTGGLFDFQIDCVGGTSTRLSIVRNDFDSVFGMWTATYNAFINMTLGTCSPFHLVHTVTNAADPTLWADGFRAFFLDYP
jgi:hypothetical protein